MQSPIPIAVLVFVVLTLTLVFTFTSCSASSPAPSPPSPSSDGNFEFIFPEFREEYEIAMGRRPRPDGYDEDGEVEVTTRFQDSASKSLTSLQRISLNTNRTDRSPPFDPLHPHWALFLVGPKCQFKATPPAREFIRKWGAWYPHLDIQYMGGTARIQMFRSQQARFDSVIDAKFWSADELMELLTHPEMLEQFEDPVATVSMEGLSEDDIAYLLEMYGVKKGFPRRDFPPLQ